MTSMVFATFCPANRGRIKGVSASHVMDGLAEIRSLCGYPEESRTKGIGNRLLKICLRN